MHLEAELFGLVASDPAASRAVDQLAVDVDRALAGIFTALAAGRGGLEAGWPRRPDAAVSVDAPLVVDLDPTLIIAYSEKEQAAPTFKRGFGFHPVRREALLIRAGVKDHRHWPVAAG